jgi:hypothetical protein
VFDRGHDQLTAPGRHLIRDTANREIVRFGGAARALVNTMSRGAAPMRSPTSRRAASTAARAVQPHGWLAEAALPKSLVKNGNMASSTRRSTGVVAW